VIHAPAEDGYRPLSEALVNLRDGLSLAVDRGVVTAAERDAFVAEVRRTFYPDRSWVAGVSNTRARAGWPPIGSRRFARGSSASVRT